MMFARAAGLTGRSGCVRGAVRSLERVGAERRDAAIRLVSSTVAPPSTGVTRGVTTRAAAGPLLPRSGVVAPHRDGSGKKAGDATARNLAGHVAYSEPEYTKRSRGRGRGEGQGQGRNKGPSRGRGTRGKGRGGSSNSSSRSQPGKSRYQGPGGQLRSVVEVVDGASFQWRRSSKKGGEEAIVQVGYSQFHKSSIPPELVELSKWYGRDFAETISSGYCSTGEKTLAAVKDEAAAAALVKFRALQQEALDLAAASGAKVSQTGGTPMRSSAGHRASLADRVRDGVRNNAAIQMIGGIPQPTVLGLFVARTELQFPPLTAELRALRATLGPSVVSVGMGYTKAEASELSFSSLDADLIAAGVNVKAKAAGFTKADILKVQADNAGQLLDMAAQRKAEFTSTQQKRGRIGSVNFQLRPIFRNGAEGDAPFQLTTNKVESNTTNAGYAALIEAERQLQARPDMDFGPINRIREAAQDAGRRVISVAVPRQPEGLTTHVRRLVQANAELATDRGSNTITSLQPRSKSSRSRPAQMPGNMDAYNAQLQSELAEMRVATPKMQAIRDALPISALRADLTKALDDHRVVVISGGTGSGKTTQIPQYILDDAIEAGRGSDVNILVTQPRRIAAVSVARRVADERNEPAGNAIGYSVRHQTKRPRPHGSIEYCTTGVVLNQLQEDPKLANVTHVIVDEVHERDINTDFLLVLLKGMLKERPDLRVLLMSATLDAKAISTYFGGAPLVEVPSAPRYPVEEIYLDDIFHAYPPSRSDARAALHDACLYEKTQFERDVKDRQRTAQQGGIPADSGMVAKAAQIQREHDGVLGKMGASNRKTKPSDRSVYIAAADLCAKLSVDLLSEAAESEDGQPRGSILCFLPGMEHIRAVERHLSSLPEYKQMKVIQLHSSVPFEDQQPVFEPSPPGKVKVILATNIAESSVTISDAVAVVDAGRVKELRYDAPRRMSVLDTVAASRASATQRKGRTGRVGPGICYRLYTRQYESLMPDRSEPEMLRTELQKTCLQAKALVPTAAITDTLGRAMDPPADHLMLLARNQLEGVGAITTDWTAPDPAQDSAVEWQGEALTFVGRRLAALPLEPQIGRMLLWGSVFKCIDPTVLAAACYSTGSPFLSVAAKREDTMRLKFNMGADGDLATNMEAYRQWEAILEQHGRREAGAWAFENNMRGTILQTIQNTKRQLFRDVSRMGIFSQHDSAEYGEPGPNLRANSAALSTALQFSGLCTNVAKKYFVTDKNHAMHTTETPHVTVGQSSMYNPMFSRFDRHRKPGKHKDLYAYTEMVLNGGVPSMREATPVRSLDYLLFGGHNIVPNLPAVTADPEQLDVLCGQIDQWTLAIGNQADFAPIFALRRMMEAVFLRRVKSSRPPGREQNDLDEQVLDTVVNVLEKGRE